jgi:hypothetical protein
MRKNLVLLALLGVAAAFTALGHPMVGAFTFVGFICVGIVSLFLRPVRD